LGLFVTLELRDATENGTDKKKSLQSIHQFRKRNGKARKTEKFKRDYEGNDFSHFRVGF